MCRELDDYDTRELTDEIIRRGLIYVDESILRLLGASSLAPFSSALAQVRMDLEGKFYEHVITQADLNRYLESIGR